MTTATKNRTLDVSLLRAGDQPSNLSAQMEIPESLTILDNPADKPDFGFGAIRVMTPKDGDKRIVWDSRVFAQIQDAKEMFDKLVLQGLVPYLVGLAGKASSEVMSEFDPHAEEIIFLPIVLVQGG